MAGGGKNPAAPKARGWCLSRSPHPITVHRRVAWMCVRPASMEKTVQLPSRSAFFRISRDRAVRAMFSPRALDQPRRQEIRNFPINRGCRRFPARSRNISTSYRGRGHSGISPAGRPGISYRNRRNACAADGPAIHSVRRPEILLSRRIDTRLRQGMARTSRGVRTVTAAILIDGEGRGSMVATPRCLAADLSPPNAGIGPIFFEFIQRKGDDGFSGEGQFQGAVRNRSRKTRSRARAC